MRDYSTFLAQRTSAERKLIPNGLYKQLLANGERTLDDPEHNALDLTPVCKLFLPGRNAVWLIVEADPEEPNRLWGIADLGIGFVEFGSVWFPELVAIRGAMNLPCERDKFCQLDQPMSHYLDQGSERGTLAGII